MGIYFWGLDRRFFSVYRFLIRDVSFVWFFGVIGLLRVYYFVSKGVLNFENF